MKKDTLTKFLLLLTDTASFLMAQLGVIGAFLLWNGGSEPYVLESEFFAVTGTHTVMILLAVLWFWIRLRHYTYRKPFWFELKEVIMTILVFSVIELAVMAFSKWYFSRYFWGMTWLVTFLVVPVGRLLIKQWLYKTGVYQKTTVIIGHAQNALEAYHALNEEKYLGFDVRYFVAATPGEPLSVDGISVLSVDDTTLFDKIDVEATQFIIALESNQVEMLDYWLKLLAKKKCRAVSVIPTLRGLPLYGTDMAFLFSRDLMILRINNNLAKRFSRLLKRITDIVGSVVFIVLFSPLLLGIYVLIAKDGGQAVYGHIRIGRDGKPFKCLKFRSMTLNAKAELKAYLAKNPKAKAEWEKDFKLKDDPRITAIGKFLRKTSLDELPQLFNVLRGSMSLVGPRPIVRTELERYAEEVDYYLMAKPGMTGLWQVSGRNDVDYKQRVYLDVWYVKNWSSWNDFVILCKTVTVFLHKKDGY